MSRRSAANATATGRGAVGGPYVGGMTRFVWQWVREQIYEGVRAAGYEDLNPAHVATFRFPTLDGLRPTELAEQLQITKQSVNDLVGHLEQLGYVTREPDPTDARARIVRLTAKGGKLERTINGQAKAVERRVAELLGTRRFEQFRSALEDLVGFIDAESVRGRA